MRDWYLGRIEAALNAFHNDHCKIERESVTVDEFGGQVKTWVMVALDVPCRVIYAGRKNQSAIEEVSKQRSMVEHYRLSVPLGTELSPGQRVTTDSGATYYIVSIVDALTDAVDSQAIITRQRPPND